MPVGLITATARLVEVEARDGVFHLSHAFAGKIHQTLGTPWASRQMGKFGYHRALRMAGCRDGDPVELTGGIVAWEYPDPEEELVTMPSGFGKWCSSADGVRALRTVTTPDPIADLDENAVRARADVITPAVVDVLTR
ncbi:MAG: hypothetical protein P8Y69_13715 [Gammaproteobacteria bacterium]